MLRNIGSKIKEKKDVLLAQGGKMFINNYIKEYGEMLKLNLDSVKKSIDMEIILDGEKEPLTVNIEKYEVTQEGAKYFIKVWGITTSRAWMNTIAPLHLEGKPFEISAEIAKVMKIVI